MNKILITRESYRWQWDDSIFYLLKMTYSLVMMMSIFSCDLWKNIVGYFMIICLFLHLNFFTKTKKINYDVL